MKTFAKSSLLCVWAKVSNSPRNLLKDVMAAEERRAVLGLPSTGFGQRRPTHREGCCHHPHPTTDPTSHPACYPLAAAPDQAEGQARAEE